MTVEVTYTDGTDTSHTINTSVVSFGTILPKAPPNQNPEFGSTTIQRSILENSEADEEVGLAVEATDPDEGDDLLTYSIGGTDASFFSIVQNSRESDSGQIKVRAGTRLDYEKKNSYRVTVTAEDPDGRKDTVTLTINVTNVDEAPVITSGYGTIYYAENGTGTVGTYVVSDPERDTITWTLDGNDKELFTIDGGLLKFKTPPDYENEAGKNTYDVTVQASDGHNTAVTMEVDVIVTNVDEAGTVSGLPERPKQGVLIEAVSTDPDGNPTDVNWQWAWASSRTGTYIDIEGEDNQGTPIGKAATYEPTEDDVGKYLRATATYKDPPASDDTIKSAHVISTRATERADYSNNPPQFPEAEVEPLNITERSVKENSAPRNQDRGPGSGYGYRQGRQAGKVDLHVGRSGCRPYLRSTARRGR